MCTRWLGGVSFLALILALAAVAGAAPAGKPVPGGYYQYWAGHGVTPGSSVTIDVGKQGTAAKVTWHLLPNAASGCASHDSSGTVPYDNQIVGGIKATITPDGSFHGTLRKADWGQVCITKN